MDSISSREAYEKLKSNAILLDIRPEYETNLRVFDVNNVVYLPYSTVGEMPCEIPKDSLLIIADSVGNQSPIVARYLREQGFSHVVSLAGGIVDWDRAGLPLKKDVDYEMIGGCACRLHPQKPI